MQTNSVRKLTSHSPDVFMSLTGRLLLTALLLLGSAQSNSAHADEGEPRDQKNSTASRSGDVALKSLREELLSEALRDPDTNATIEAKDVDPKRRHPLREFEPRFLELARAYG